MTFNRKAAFSAAFFERGVEFMSTREYAHMIIDELTEEQLEDFITRYQAPPGVPSVESVDSEEILALLEEAEEDVRNGRVYPWEEVKAELEGKYGI